MEIIFRNTKLEKLCNNRKEAQRTFGAKIAKKLLLRLLDLDAAECLDDIYKLPQLRCHQLSPKNERKFAIDITERWRIIFKPDHNPIPELPDGGINRQEIFSIKIINVEDYHG